MAYATQSANFVSASTQALTRADSVALSVTANLTIEGWFQFTTTPGSGGQYRLVTKLNRTGNQRSYAFGLNNNAGTLELRGEISSLGSNLETITTAWTPTTGTWYHLAFVYTAATSKYQFFINGTQQGTDQTGALTAIFDSTATFYISGNQGDEAATSFNGRASLVRVWATTRTGVQLSANYCTLLGSTTNLQGEWSLDNVLTDNSGNSQTLTNVNTTTFVSDIPSTCSATTFLSLTGAGS